jgi:phosphatidylglycerophosphatase A
MTNIMLDKPALFIARALGAGKSPYAPGTVGSLLAVILAPWCFYPLEFWWRVVLLVVLFVIGAWAGGRAARILNKKDPGEVVIDEVLGQWLTILWLPVFVWWQLVLAFILFRLFDITKPWIIRISEDWLPGGWGIMLDDVMAGGAAALCLYLINLLVDYILLK